MLRRTPQLDEDLIMAGVNNPNGPAVRDTSKIMAAHAGKQFADQSAMDAVQNSLDDSKSRFDQTMRFNKGQLKYNEGQQNIANLVSVGNLGLAGYGAHKQKQYTTEYNKGTDQLIQQLRARGGINDEFQANILERLKRQR